MNMKPAKSKITEQPSGNGKAWNLPSKKGVGFLMIFGAFFSGLPLVILSVTIISSITGTGQNNFDSWWGLLFFAAFLSVFVLSGGLAFYFGFRMRYTSFQVTAHGGAVQVIKRFFNKETQVKLERGQVLGIGLYSSSETNGRPDYGLLVKAKSGNDIKISNGYKEDELRWLASEILAELDQQGGLPSNDELEETYFSSHDSSSEASQRYLYTKKGVTISPLQGESGNQFIIEKSGATIGKSMIFGGLFAIIFSGVFTWIGFGEEHGDLIFGIVGILIGSVALVIFVAGLLKLGTTEKFTFKEDQIVKEKLRGGVSKSKSTSHKSSYQKLKIASSGNSNNETRYSVKLMTTGSTKPLKIFSWIDHDTSQAVKLKVNAWLKPKPEATTEATPSISNAYGSAMTTEPSQGKLSNPQPRTQPNDVLIYNSNANLKDIKGGIWMLRIFLSLFLCIGLGLTIFGVLNYITAKESENWPSVEGIILESKISISHGDDSTTYGADVSYRFQVEGNHHEGDKVTVSEMSTSNHERARKIVQRYPVGNKTTVFYDPENPDESVLEPGLSSGNWLLPGVGLVFFIVPFIMLVLTEKSNRKDNKRSKTSRNSVKNIESRYGRVD